jgi:hypothetical protein
MPRLREGAGDGAVALAQRIRQDWSKLFKVSATFAPTDSDEINGILPESEVAPLAAMIHCGSNTRGYAFGGCEALRVKSG